MDAGIKTLLLFLILLVTGFVIRFVSQMITLVIAIFVGERASLLFCNYITWPGTVHHEFSHALAAVLTGAKVTRISLVRHGDKLGEVNFIARGGRLLIGFQMAIISIAPIVCGVITEALLYSHVLPVCDSRWKYALLLYLMISILLHMTLSGQDMQNLSKGIVPTLLVFYVFFLIAGFFDLF